MAIELRVPEVGESISEVEIGRWLVAVGERVSKDQKLVEIETDKVTVELPAPADGAITAIEVEAGQAASVGDLIGRFEEGAGEARAASESNEEAEAAASESPPSGSAAADEPRVMPAARRILEQGGIDAGTVEGTGPGGRITKGDALAATSSEWKPSPAAEPAARPSPSGSADSARPEEVVPMSPLRRRVADRLVEAQQTAAILTTFNEIDMTAVKALRKEYQEAFEKKHGVRLGFMSFFVKAAVEALKLVPGVNAEIRDRSIVYRNYYDIGIAVGGGKGLVVPIVRNAETLGFAEIELKIADYARRAQGNSLTIDELTGGTFTISNGGIYGSLLSTPILNPPQSGILGLHAIQDRPVAIEGRVEIRPMMYVALSYDHRLIDGREAVTFLKRIKETIEAPTRILLEV